MLHKIYTHSVTHLCTTKGNMSLFFPKLELHAELLLESAMQVQYATAHNDSINIADNCFKINFTLVTFRAG